MRLHFSWFKKAKSDSGADPAAASARPLFVECSMSSDVGQVRAANQDAVVFFEIPARGDTSRALAAIVADGMGGHAAGEVASQIAIDTLRRSLSEGGAKPATLLAKALEDAHRAILRHAAEHPDTEGMGTTCTAAFVRDNGLWLGHVGDSRAYLLRDGRLEQLTQDHSLHAQLIRDGLMSEEEAATAQGRNLLLQALGARNGIEPQVPQSAMPLQAGDCVMLCSDGLHGLVAPDRIQEILQTQEPRSACQALIEAANSAGGYDNISVGVLKFSLEPPKSQPCVSSTRPSLQAAP